MPHICAFSAYKGKEDKLKSLEYGMDNFIEKPIDNKKFQSLIKIL